MGGGVGRLYRLFCLLRGTKKPYKYALKLHNLVHNILKTPIYIIKITIFVQDRYDFYSRSRYKYRPMDKKSCIMKRLFFVFTIASVFFASCTAFKSASLGDDLYSAHDRVEIAKRQKAIAEAARIEAEANQAAWEAKLAEARALAAEKDFHGTKTIYQSDTANPYQSVLADDYQSAYARRLYGFNSPSYRMPSSYYTYRYSDDYQYASAYDPAFYNVMVSGDQVWVEPKYITSMFGSWGAAVASPSYGWYYGWRRPYLSWWYGYPHYSWYDWGMGYDPYWGWNYGYWWSGYPYYPGFIPPHHHHRPPHFDDRYHRPTIAVRPNSSRPGGRPAYNTGSGNHNAPQGISSGRGQYRGSGTVTGSGQYRGNSSGRSNSLQYRDTRSSYNQRNDNNSFRESNSGSRGYSGGYSGGGNFSGGSHGGGQGRR